MAAGLPVVVSRKCGCSFDLVFPGVNGFIVDEKDVPGMAAALVELAKDDVRRQAYGQQSSRLVATFSLETWAAALVNCTLTIGA